MTEEDIVRLAKSLCAAATSLGNERPAAAALEVGRAMEMLRPHIPAWAAVED